MLLSSGRYYGGVFSAILVWIATSEAQLVVSAPDVSTSPAISVSVTGPIASDGVPLTPLDDIKSFYMGTPSSLPTLVRNAVRSAIRIGRIPDAASAAATLLQVYSAYDLFSSDIASAAYKWCASYLNLPDPVCYTATTSRARSVDLLLMALCAGGRDLSTCWAPKNESNALVVPPRIHTLRQLMRAASLARSPAVHRVFNTSAVCDNTDFPDACRTTLATVPASTGKTLLVMTSRPETFEEANTAISAEVSAFATNIAQQLRSVPRHVQEMLPHAMGSYVRKYVDKFSAGRLKMALDYLLACMKGFSEDADGPFLPASYGGLRDYGVSRALSPFSAVV